MHCCRRFICLLVSAPFLFGASIPAAEPLSASRWLQKGDEAYAQFDNRAALEQFRNALERDPKNYEAAWKLARAYVDVGEGLDDREKRREHYKKAYTAARKAVEIRPEGSKGHLYLSISLGRVALDEGAKEKVRLSKEVKEEADRALELDPNEDIAWHVLALWHRNVATLSWIEKKFADLFLGGVPEEASLESAVICLKRAIGLNPRYVNHYLELGITYELMGKDGQAMDQYRKALQLPIGDSDDKAHKEEARRRIEQLS